MSVQSDVRDFLGGQHPFDLLPGDAIDDIAAHAEFKSVPAAASVYQPGDRVAHLFFVASGSVDVISAEGEPVSHCVKGETFGARAILRGGIATNLARTAGATELVLIDAAGFQNLMEAYPAFAAFFQRRYKTAPVAAGAGEGQIAGQLAASRLADIMTPSPVCVDAMTSVRDAALLMAEKHISCVLITSDGRLVGLLTTGDMTSKVVAGGLGGETPVSWVMTQDPFSLGPDALVYDAMVAMSEYSIGHLPVVANGRPVGILTRTNLVRQQSVSAVYMVSDIGKLSAFDDLAAVVANVPQLLAQLVGAGTEAHKVGHVLTSITDALTKRLLVLAEEKFGPAPVPYLWFACGSQGRREQTGVSDQDNCIFLDDHYDAAAHGDYFAQLAHFVSDGLNAAGFVYCPGDMMATNPRWCQPMKVWRSYFEGWISRPDPMAQMLASVMFDLRPIAGEGALFHGLQRETLARAKANSIFRAHMIANSLKHTPPLGIFRGFALIRSGEHKDTVDLKHSGVVPIVDLARLYALDGAIEAVNTRERLSRAREIGTVSKTGGEDLIDAYDLIANTRLEHQARQIRAGLKPDNYLAPGNLSALDRNHLKDAFGIIKTMQSALAHSRAAS